MKKHWLLIFTVLIALFAMSGCANLGGPNPQSDAELFPVYNDTVAENGIIILDGEQAINILITDQYGKRLPVIGERGGNPFLTIRGRVRTRILRYHLKPGWYKVRYRTFYYTGPLFRRRVESPERIGAIQVREGRSTYDRVTRRHYSWVFYVNTGRVPHGHSRLPRVNVSVKGGILRILADAYNNSVSSSSLEDEIR
jgi:hypothetical protein